MAETTVVKKTLKKTEEHGMLDVVLEGILGVMKGWFESARMSVETAIEDAVMRVARQVFVIFLALLGIAFLLFGLAKSLSFLFRMPGIGETIVGCMALVIAFILTSFTRERK